MPALRARSAYAAVLAVAALTAAGLTQPAPAPAAAAVDAATPATAPPSSRSARSATPSRADRSWPGGSVSRARDARWSCSRRCTATSRAPARILYNPARRATDPRRRPLGGPAVQPRRARPRTRQNARGVDLNRNYPHHWKRPRRQLRLRPAPGLRAGDQGGHGVPAAGPPRRRASASTSRCTASDTDTKGAGSSGGCTAACGLPATVVQLRRALPRHHDRVVQRATSAASALTVEYGRGAQPRAGRPGHRARGSCSRAVGAAAR